MSHLLRASSGHLMRSSASGHLRLPPTSIALSYSARGCDYGYYYDGDGPQTKDTVWPAIKTSFPYDWNSTFGSVDAFWSPRPYGAVIAEAWVTYMRFDVSAYAGRSVQSVDIAITTYGIRPGSGAAMVGVQTSSSSTPGSSYSWLEGSFTGVVTATGTKRIYTSMTLSNYLFLTFFIDDIEPATSPGSSYFTHGTVATLTW